MRGTRKCIPGSGDASECHSCLGIVTNAMRDGNRFNPGSSVVINCAQCGHGIAKTKANQGTLYKYYFQLIKDQIICVYSLS